MRHAPQPRQGQAPAQLSSPCPGLRGSARPGPRALRTRPGEVKVGRMAENTTPCSHSANTWNGIRPGAGWASGEGLIECTSEEDHCAGERIEGATVSARRPRERK